MHPAPFLFARVFVRQAIYTPPVCRYPIGCVFIAMCACLFRCFLRAARIFASPHRKSWFHIEMLQLIRQMLRILGKRVKPIKPGVKPVQKRVKPVKPMILKKNNIT